MQSDNRFIDDMGKLATGALGMVQSLRDEVETMVRQRLERAIADLDVVTRDEFEAVKAVAAETRAENEKLKARLEALEKSARSPKKTSRASGARKSGSSKSSTSKS